MHRSGTRLGRVVVVALALGCSRRAATGSHAEVNVPGSAARPAASSAPASSGLDAGHSPAASNGSALPIAFAVSVPPVPGPPFRLQAETQHGDVVPAPGGSWITALVELGGVVFAAADVRSRVRTGGVFRSEDGGAHFRRASRGLPRVRTNGYQMTLSEGVFDPYVPITALAIDQRVLLAGTVLGQVFRSADGGQSFAPTRGLPEPRSLDDGSNRVMRILVTAGHAYVLTRTATYGSTDHGETWERTKLVTSDGFERLPTSLAVDAGKLYAATSEGVWVSADEGATFRLTPLEEPYEVRARQGSVWAAPVSPDRPVYVSRDAGKSFRAVPPLLHDAGRGTIALYPFGLNPPASGEALRNVGYALNNVLDALETGHTVLLATSDGVRATRDRGASVERPGNGITTEAVERVAVSDAALFVHLARESGALWSTVHGEPAFRVVGYGGNDARALFARGADVLVGDEQGRLFRSRDAGKTFEQLALPLNTPPGPVEVLAVRGKNQLLVRGGILVSRDGGDTWRDLRAGVPLEPKEEFGSYRYRIPCGEVTDHALLLCGARGVLRVSEQEDWAEIRLPNDPGPVLGIANDAGRVLLVTPGALYASKDEGRSFEAVAASLPDGLTLRGLGAEQGEIVVTAGNVEARAAQDGTLVLWSGDGGRSWVRVSTGLELLPTSPPVRGEKAWYVGLQSDGVYRFTGTARAP